MTKKPRLTITLNNSLAIQLKKLSVLTGNSQSALIADLLEGSSPVFERMITILEAAEKAKLSMKGKISGDLKDAQNALNNAFAGFDNIEKFLNEMENSKD